MLFHTTQGGGFVQGSSCKAQENLPNPVLQEKKTPDIEQTNGALTVQWISTNFHESKQVQLECIWIVTCSRSHQGWIQTAMRTGLLQINSPKKPINRVCPCEESTDEPRESETSTTGQGRLRWGFKRLQGRVGNVKSTWPGCEVKQVGDLSLLQDHSHISHTHPWTEVVIANT